MHISFIFLIFDQKPKFSFATTHAKILMGQHAWKFKKLNLLFFHFFSILLYIVNNTGTHKKKFYIWKLIYLQVSFLMS